MIDAIILSNDEPELVFTIDSQRLSSIYLLSCKSLKVISCLAGIYNSQFGVLVVAFPGLEPIFGFLGIFSPFLKKLEKSVINSS